MAPAPTPAAAAGRRVAVLAAALVAASLAASVGVANAAVSYDRRSLVINGRRRILLSGSIHYPRSTPEVRTPHPWPPPKCATSLLSLSHVHLRFLILASYASPSPPPQMWPGLIQKAKDGGLDVIQTYVFWNGHEPVQGQVLSLSPHHFFFFFLRVLG